MLGGQTLLAIFCLQYRAQGCTQPSMLSVLARYQVICLVEILAIWHHSILTSLSST